MKVKYKRVLSIVILTILYSVSGAIIIYSLYIKPISGMKDITHWADKGIVVIVLTLLYSAIIALFFLIADIADWCNNNLKRKK